jgi:hypothetical protein
MDYIIPLSYNLNIKELYNNYSYSHNNNEIIIDNFKLYINKNNIIYKISSDISLEYLLNFLNGYEQILIKKLYYYLIIKHLLNLKFKIKTKYFYNWSCFEDNYFDIVIRTRQYHITHNTEIIITDKINYNICLIITNNTNNKNFVCIIDNKCIIDCLYDIIDNNIYSSNRYEDIRIIIIGGSIDTVNIIIEIYNILKDLKIAKYIYKTHLFKDYSLNRLKINTIDDSLYFIPDNNYYSDDNSNHINNDNYSSILKRI